MIFITFFQRIVNVKEKKGYLPLLSKIVETKFTKGEKTLTYKNSSTYDEYREVDFLKTKLTSMYSPSLCQKIEE